MRSAILITTLILTFAFSLLTNAAEEGSDLSLKEADARKARLSEITYTLFVNLPEKGETFSGKSVARFQLKDVKNSLRLDFFGGKVVRVSANGQQLEPATVQKAYGLELPASALNEGANAVEVVYTQTFSHQSQGLSQFTDPQTKEVFLYSQFESFDANRFMPCFDQPDLRATLTLTVEAPAKWQVISTTLETSVKAVGKGRKLWTFPESPQIATYLFSLHAGPYKVWKDKYEDIPLRLFARPSMAKYVHEKDWFRWTKAGLKFYNGYFGLKYPFKKYDQVIAPEFDQAMENVAAVTFSEDMLSRSKPTRTMQRLLAETLLHEMAHMWFGDVVTMKWWNDLWLNESIASFMSALALLEATEFDEAWQHFYSEFKVWGYFEDSLATTHPIEAPINSVKESNAIFDGVTYGKGASVLKQLWAYVTPDQFREGLRDYFRAYAFKNTELPQFIASLQAHTPNDLKTWSARWLKQSGTDWIRASWKCEGEKLKRIEVTSTSKQKAEFRPQGLDVALFLDGSVKPDVIHVSMNKPSDTLKGDWHCPNFIYPNYGDGAFAQIEIDPQSLTYLKSKLGSLDDSLLRQQIWGNLWEMVRADTLALPVYVEFLRSQFMAEKNEMVLEQVVTTITGRKRGKMGVLLYWPPEDKDGRLAFVAEMEKLFLSHLEKTKAGSDEQKFWFASFAHLAQTPAALAKLAQWSVKSGLKLDLDQQWALARQLMRYDRPEGKALVARLKKADGSDRGKLGALSAEAVQPSNEVKAKWVKLFSEAKSKFSNQEADTVLSSLFPLEQITLAKSFAADYYRYLGENGRAENEGLVRYVAQGLSPLDCDPAESKRLTSFVTEHANGFSPVVAKELKVQLQEDDRCQAIRRTARGSLAKERSL